MIWVFGFFLKLCGLEFWIVLLVFFDNFFWVLFFCVSRLRISLFLFGYFEIYFLKDVDWGKEVVLEFVGIFCLILIKFSDENWVLFNVVWVILIVDVFKEVIIFNLCNWFGIGNFFE